MRMIEIETKKGTVLINPKQITSIRNFEGTIMIAMAGGHSVALLNAGELLMIFPEGVPGFVEPFSTRFTRRMDAEVVRNNQFKGDSQ